MGIPNVSFGGLTWSSLFGGSSARAKPPSSAHAESEPSATQPESAFIGADRLRPYPSSPKQWDSEVAYVNRQVAERRMRLPPRQQGILKSIERLPVSPVDVWHGSHIVVQDGGRLYRSWSAGAMPRISSHYSLLDYSNPADARQFGYDFGKLGGLLFGLTPDGDTWFQMEADPPTSVAKGLEHLLDLGVHAARHQNVGPLGLSPHTLEAGTELVVRDRR